MKRSNVISILDPALCDREVSVYHREGLTRRLLTGVHFVQTQALKTDLGRAEASGEFLLVIPGDDPIAPGDLVVAGAGPEALTRDTQTARVLSVRKCHLLGQVSHTEARGS
jgi:hypothetical protein